MSGRFFGVDYTYRPGDEKRIDLADPKYARSAAKLFTTVGRTWFRTTLTGIKHVPRKGPALFVANHGVMAVESPFFMAEVLAHTKRMVRALGDHFLWRIPMLRERALLGGVVDGNPQTALKLLKAGELVVVYPEGARGGAKTWGQRYQLDWTGRYGFVKLALQANVPILPMVTIGADDAYYVLNDPYKWARRLLKSESMPLPLPIGLGLLPMPTRFAMEIGPPIRFPEYGPKAATNERLVHKLQKQVWTVVKGMLERGLAKRRTVLG